VVKWRPIAFDEILLVLTALRQMLRYFFWITLFIITSAISVENSVREFAVLVRNCVFHKKIHPLIHCYKL
jgi:hypothetical protein